MRTIEILAKVYDIIVIPDTYHHANGLEIIIDDNEILEADWFSVDDLPAIPGGFSISRKLLDAFVNRIKRERRHE